MVADRPVAMRARGLGGVQALLLEPLLADLGQVGAAGHGFVLAQLLELLAFGQRTSSRSLSTPASWFMASALADSSSFAESQL